MKKFLSLLLVCLMVAALLAGCAKATPTAGQGGAGTGEGDGGGGTVEEPTNNPDVTTINIWSFTDEVPGMIEKFKAEHPDFPYTLNTTIIATTNGEYQPALDAALQAGGANAPDLYTAEAAFVAKYSQGAACQYAATYKELGIDVDTKLAEARIASYAVEIGTRNSEVVGLPYQATGGAFIYRRSIAKDVWGTDDPTEIKNKIGPGWDKFFEAAEALKGKGYAIVSGDGDIWHAIENGSDSAWVVDGKLNIDPKREAFLDYSKKLTDEGYSNVTQDWTDAWFADMQGTGEKPVFGYFGPAWLINYVMSGNVGDTFGDWAVCEPTEGFCWGGTWLFVNKDSQVKAALAEIIEWITLDTSETGLQYQWANGTYNPDSPTKDSVASATVMDNSDGTLDILGGQNMFDIFVPAGDAANGTIMTEFDETINGWWRDQVRNYAAGQKTRDAAIADFKQQVADNLDVVVE